MTALRPGRLRTTATRWIARLACAAAILAAAFAWRPLRAKLVDRLALDSIACPPRHPLLRDALAARFPEQSGDPAQLLLATIRGPHLTLVGWQSGAHSLTEREGRIDRLNFADGQLNFLGAIRVNAWYAAAPPGDWNRDGCPELLLEHTVRRRRPPSSVQYWAVLSLAQPDFKLVAVVAADTSWYQSAGMLLLPEWDDESGALRFNGWHVTSLDATTPATPQVRLEWSTAGGSALDVIHPVPANILVWCAPADRPVTIPSEIELGRLVRKVLVVPSDFGVALERRGPPAPDDEAGDH